MAALPAFGTKFLRGNGAGPEVFTEIAEVGDIEGPGFSTTTFDASSHSSPNALMEKAAGLIDAGDITLPINWFPGETTHQQLIDDLFAREIVNYQIVWPDLANTTWTIPGIVTGFSPSAPINDKLSAEVTITVAGLPTFS